MEHLLLGIQSIIFSKLLKSQKNFFGNIFENFELFIENDAMFLI